MFEHATTKPMTSTTKIRQQFKMYLLDNIEMSKAVESPYYYFKMHH